MCRAPLSSNRLSLAAEAEAAESKAVAMPEAGDGLAAVADLLAPPQAWIRELTCSVVPCLDVASQLLLRRVAGKSHALRGHSVIAGAGRQRWERSQRPALCKEGRNRDRERALFNPSNQSLTSDNSCIHPLTARYMSVLACYMKMVQQLCPRPFSSRRVG